MAGCYHPPERLRRVSTHTGIILRSLAMSRGFGKRTVCLFLSYAAVRYGHVASYRKGNATDSEGVLHYDNDEAL